MRESALVNFSSLGCVRRSNHRESMPNNLIFEKQLELGKLIQVAYLVVILAAFAWAKEFLLPLILAILISFLLAPLVSRLERWRFPRVIAF
jgi:AI-2 transport protein TqsA